MKVFSTDHRLLKGMFYGVPGCGKSYLGDSANEDERSSPVLHLNCAGNPVVPAGKEQRYIVTVESYADLNGWYTYLANDKIHPDVLPFFKYWQERDEVATSPKFKAVVLDQLTELQSRQLEVLLDNTNIALGGELKRATRGDFGKLLALTTQLARLFYALPMHVLIMAWEQPIYGNTDPPTITGYQPSLIGKAMTVVPGFAHILGRMVAFSSLNTYQKSQLKVEKAHSIVSFAAERALTKDQWSKFGASMVDPTVTKLLDVLEQGGPMK